MNDNQTENLELHDRQVEAISAAVAKLLPRFQHQGFTPEALFEGALKGGMLIMFAARDVTMQDVAALYEGFGAALREASAKKGGNLHVVE